MKLTPSMFRMCVCSLVGLGLIMNGINAMQTVDLAQMAYVPFMSAFEVAVGTFILMYAFSPSLGKSIIKSITSILRHRRY